MAIEENAEVKTQSTWGTEGRSAERSHQFDREGGAVQSSSQHGDLGQRIAGASGARTAYGGILARMIADKRQRLREVDECLDWYQREKTQRQTELDDLEQFASQLQAEETE